VTGGRRQRVMRVALAPPTAGGGGALLRRPEKVVPAAQAGLVLEHIHCAHAHRRRSPCSLLCLDRGLDRLGCSLLFCDVRLGNGEVPAVRFIAGSRMVLGVKRWKTGCTLRYCVGDMRLRARTPRFKRPLSGCLCCHLSVVCTHNQ
jgi:hypothetical protein